MQSDFQSSRGAGSEAKPTPSKEGARAQVKNQPFDEALDLSASDASVSRQGSEHRGSPNRADTSMSDAKTPNRRGGGGAAKREGRVENQRHDETFSLGDEDDLSTEESLDTNDSENIGAGVMCVGGGIE